MALIKKLTGVVTSVAIGTPVDLGATPLGNGRNAILRCVAVPLTSTLLIQTAPSDPDTKAVPASGSALWTTICTLTSADDVAQEITGLQKWVRANCTALDADGPDIVMFIEGAK